MPDKLPTKLNKEPLIDALFEMRFNSAPSASSILPGLLFSKLEGERIIEDLPIAQIPKALRDADSNLRFAPLVRLNLEGFSINIGDRSLAIGCKMPYPGWSVFKPIILNTVKLLKDTGLVQEVHRFSMKYIDLIPAHGTAMQVSAINSSVVLGKHTLTQEVFSLRIEIPKEEILHAVQITSSATAILPDGSKREGLIVDIDSIWNLSNPDFSQWLEQLPDQLELIHTANKAMFFECLRPETIDALEPVYE